MVDRHASKELTIFARFARAVGEFVETSIEKRQFPEPDIVVSAVAGERMAFELVELIDERFAQRAWGSLKLKLKLENSFTRAMAIDKTEIEKRLGNALVHITFGEDQSFRAREAAIPGLLEYFKSIDAMFTGELRVGNGLQLPQAVSSIRIGRGAFAGPCFDIDAMGSHADPTVDAIRGKCEKQYSSPHPMELLAYYELQSEFPEILWRPWLERFLATPKGAVAFRRVWVYDCGSNEVRFSTVVSPPGRGA